MNPDKESQFDIEVVIPVYNGEEFVGAALDSVIGQTHAPTRIIVVDDGSTDGTAEIVSGKGADSPIEIRHIKKENGGLSSARNAGLAEATSEWVAFLDADDVWHPAKLERQVAVVQETVLPNLGLVYCGYSLIDHRGQGISNTRLVVPHPDIRGQAHDRLLQRNRVSGSGSAVLVRRSVFDEVGGFDENLSAAEDWDMWLRITKKYDIDYVNADLVRIRLHEKNMQANRLHMFRNKLKFFEKWAGQLPPGRLVPWHWPVLLSTDVVGRFPQHDFLDMLVSDLSPAARKRLFSRTFGSTRLFLVLALGYTVYRSFGRFVKYCVIILFGKHGKNES